MQISDYIHYFNTPDKLVDFLMLEVDQQNAILKRLIEAGILKGEMTCKIPQKREAEHITSHLTMPRNDQHPFRPAS